MSVVDVTQLLLQAQNPDHAARTQAEQALQTFQERDFAGFIASLSAELSNASKPADSRRLAGLVLKNMLDAKEEARRQELQGRWIQLDAGLKVNIRGALLATLRADDREVRHTAALVTAKVASIELPRKEWPDLVNSLMENMRATPPVPGTRQATLEALGYVCEEMALRSDDVLSPPEINMILTAVVAGMAENEPDLVTRVTATTALCNAIEFASQNFENEGERTYIMQVVCSGAKSPDANIRRASFECLHEIAARYYAKLPAYMTEVYNISVAALGQDNEDVSLQAIEFWSTLCDQELDIKETGEEPYHGFIPAAAPHLVPILLQLLTKQEEGQDQDDTAWNVSMAAGTCLSLVAKVAGNVVLGPVMGFVFANINKTGGPEDWRLREAATYAFGSVLDGPEPGQLLDTVKQALPFLLSALRDPSAHVKDTTAWAIGRIFDYWDLAQEADAVARAGPLLTKETLHGAMVALVESLKDEAHIVYRVCNTVGKLASACSPRDEGASPSLLSPYFNNTVAELMKVAQRFAGFEHSRVQIAAFEAINDLVRAASADTLPVVAQLIPIFLAEINRTFEMPVNSAEARDRQADVQGQLCGVLQVLVSTLSKHKANRPLAMAHGDQIMETLLRIFQQHGANVHEEAMLAIGSFTYCAEKAFVKYMPAFASYLKIGLTNHQEWQVCLATVGALGDVCRNIEEEVLPYCDELLEVLLVTLGRPDVHRAIKPPFITAFGDVAVVVGDKFVKYLEPVKSMMQSAMATSMRFTQTLMDEDLMDYNNDLRLGILEALSGLFNGMSNVACEQHLKSEVGAIFHFVTSIAATQPYDDDVVKNTVNLLGDILSKMPSVGDWLKSLPPDSLTGVTTLAKYCESSDDLTAGTEFGLNQLHTLGIA